MLLERSWWAGRNGIYLVRFGFRMWEILIFYVISATENSNKFQKVRLEGNISWEHGNTWKLTIQFKHDFLSYLAVQKINTYIAKQCSHVEFPSFVMGSYLGQWHRPHYLWLQEVPPLYVQSELAKIKLLPLANNCVDQGCSLLHSSSLLFWIYHKITC